jgi:hypothetical protein
MAFVETQDGAKVVLTWASDFGPWSNTLWFRKADFTTTDLETLALRVKKTFVDDFVDLLAVGVSLPSVQAYDMRTYDGEIRVASYSDGTGDVDDDVLPPSVCMVATLRTGKRGRAYRGRFYSAGWAELNLSDGEFGATQMGDLETALDSLRTTLAAYGWAWGVRTTQVDGVPLDPYTITDITTIEVRNGIPGSQRRRNRRP